MPRSVSAPMDPYERRQADQCEAVREPAKCELCPWGRACAFVMARFRLDPFRHSESPVVGYLGSRVCWSCLQVQREEWADEDRSMRERRGRGLAYTLHVVRWLTTRVLAPEVSGAR